MKLSWLSRGFSLEIFSSKGKKRKILNWIYLLFQQQLLHCHIMGEHTFVGERNVSWRYLIMLWLLQGKRDGCTAIVGMWVRLARVQVPDLPVPSYHSEQGQDTDYLWASVPSSQNREEAYLLYWMLVMFLTKLVHFKCLARCGMETMNVC